MPPRDKEQPLLRVNAFEVLIGDRELGFSDVGPLTSETDLDTPLDKPPHRFASVVLRRALTGTHELYDWRRAVIDGKDDRRDVTIRQLSGARRQGRERLAAGQGLAAPLVRADVQCTQRRHRLGGARTDLRGPRLARADLIQGG